MILRHLITIIESCLSYLFVDQLFLSTSFHHFDNMPSIPTLPPNILAKYQPIRELGHGAYGLVVSAKCKIHQENVSPDVAIKKITKVFDKQILTKRTLREIKILRFFNSHENITSLLDLELPCMTDFNEVYLVQELMEADLHQIIRSEQSLTDSHFQYFIYQTCRGLKYIHSANVSIESLRTGSSSRLEARKFISECRL